MTMQDTLHAGERVLAHVAAIVAGVILMIVGVGMGVTVALIPIAIPLGLFGLMLFAWGLSRDKARRQA